MTEGTPSSSQTTSTSRKFHAGSASALATASLAQKRAARCCTGRRARRRVGELPIGEQPLRQPRRALQRPLETVDLQQVKPDPWLAW